MRFEILDVEHGFAAYAIALDGCVKVFDCGYSPYVRPSDVLLERGVSEIDHLFISHFDEDHIGDLPQLQEYFSIKVLTRNRSLPSRAVRQMKTVITPAMREMLKMHEKYINPASVPCTSIETEVFHNSYSQFKDSNNLSLLVFMKMGNTTFLLTGDLERPGWLSLLKKRRVQTLLGHVDYFIASHHGRENGYCEEVFKYCSPKAIIFSDASIAYDTQKMSSVYGQHASGISINGKRRRVLTTRNDGPIYWEW